MSKKLTSVASPDEFDSLKEEVSIEAQGIRVNLLYAEDTDVIGIEGRQELPPLGLLYIAGTLRGCGINTSVIPFSEKTDVTEIPPADIFGYGITSTAVYRHFIALRNKMRSIEKGILHVAGNTQPRLNPQHTINELNIHGVLEGESEFGILQLVRNFVRHGISESVFKDIAGSSYRDTDNKTTINNLPNKIIGDLDKIAFPARDLLSENRILLHNRLKSFDSIPRSLITFITSRGCPFSCAFCANLNNGSIRYRGVDNMRQEILYLKTLYPDIGGLLIMDETATLTESHVASFSRAIKGTGLLYVLSTRGDVITPQKLELLKDSGCFEIKFGLETGSQKLLDMMNKKIDLDKMLEGIKLSKRSGIQTKVFLMHGFPGENLSTTNETINFLKTASDYIDRAVVYRFTPLPGSPVFEKAEHFNLRIKDRDFSDFTIYKNSHHWWGTVKDFEEVNQGYELLQSFVNENFRR